MIGPALLMTVAVLLILLHLAGRRRWQAMNRTERRAAWRLLADLARAVPVVALFAMFMIAPRHVAPGQRIPRPKARRMVQAMDADTARKLVD